VFWPRFDPLKLLFPALSPPPRLRLPKAPLDMPPAPLTPLLVCPKLPKPPLPVLKPPLLEMPDIPPELIPPVLPVRCWAKPEVVRAKPQARVSVNVRDIRIARNLRMERSAVLKNGLQHI